ncbi:U3 small nucleolar RNA-associated protein 11 [Nadsonia fulvescens var. elongata DSM 6958]|uniref:U3 small nucleolar RNA-associated protein 11 n=1 Tax=Nadsonia fulvescens var. elongata DSM 6958 TaxID=857566 RepID=A0A1E3PEU3_9ASCO|nr:U3 small nucleolar RNA-associated protein 11 [Nadsonia fulvescens var. elongata DSM 6958]
MANFTHNIAKKQHKERAQPIERKKLGLLEKKKDYQLRSKDYHAKQARLKLLRKKVSERNPDEFHHGMLSSKTDDRGILQKDRGNEVLSVDAAKLLKTQDSGYVKTMRNNEIRKIEKLEKELILKAVGKHTVFVDSASEAQSFDVAKYFNTDKSLINRRENRLRRSQLEDTENIISKSLEGFQQQKINKKRASKYKELESRMKRESELSQVNSEMDLQRELMKKGDKKKITNKDGSTSWKWKKERKR